MRYPNESNQKQQKRCHICASHCNLIAFQFVCAQHENPINNNLYLSNARIRNLIFKFKFYLKATVSFLSIRFGVSLVANAAFICYVQNYDSNVNVFKFHFIFPSVLYLKNETNSKSVN